MSCDHRYPLPQVFIVDGAADPEQPAQPPNLVPCWSFPPPMQERVRGRRKTHVSPCLVLMVLLLFLLVFAALGFGGYQIYKMQNQLRQMKGETSKHETEFKKAEKQISLRDPQLQIEKRDDRPAAHLIGKIEKEVFRKTLRWDPKVGQAFFTGGVTYRMEDGGLQVNESGLYHIYSRVELLFDKCSSSSSFIHSMFVRRVGHPSPLTLMESHRAGFCPQLWEYPRTTESFLSSGVKLQKYDKVFVNLSHPSLLSHEHYASFFGLYKI